MNTNVVLIADRIKDFQNINIYNNDLECIPDDYFNQVYEGLLKVSNGVVHYNDPEVFCENINKHKKDIVLSIWSGKNSRFRKSLVPAICESNNICYVGADPYVHFISQDKYITKYVCSQYGINSAKGVVYEKEEDSKKIYSLKLPIVVKPNCEGGSIGISNDNLKYDYDSAILLAQKLLKSFNLPILIEEYIEGKEISVSMIGNCNGVEILEASQLIIGDKSYFDRQLYSYEPKVNDPENRHFVSATHLLNDELKAKFQLIFHSIGKVELMRIDGRLNMENEFTLIELTPDAYIGKRGSTTFCLNNIKIDYESMLEKLLLNAYYDYERRQI